MRREKWHFIWCRRRQTRDIVFSHVHTRTYAQSPSVRFTELAVSTHTSKAREMPRTCQINTAIVNREMNRWAANPMKISANLLPGLTVMPVSNERYNIMQIGENCGTRATEQENSYQVVSYFPENLYSKHTMSEFAFRKLDGLGRCNGGQTERGKTVKQWKASHTHTHTPTGKFLVIFSFFHLRSFVSWWSAVAAKHVAPYGLGSGRFPDTHTFKRQCTAMHLHISFVWQGMHIMKN